MRKKYSFSYFSSKKVLQILTVSIFVSLLSFNVCKPVLAASYVAGGGTASGSNAVAIGTSASSTGSGSVAIGNSTSAAETSSVALGEGSKALSYMSVALAGGTVTADKGWGFAANGGTVQGYNSVAIGRETKATSRNALAIGDYTTAGACSIALGESAQATGFSESIAIGTDSKSTESYTIALGYNSQAAAESTVAIGNGASVSATQSVALGTGSVAVDKDVISVGHKNGDKVGTYTWTNDYFRRIVNVANGVNAHDAVTVAQLNAAVSGNSYTLPTATSSVLGGVKTGSNITNSSGTISLTKANVVAALGYTPPTADTNTTYSAATSSALGLVKVGSNITNSSGTISLTKANVTAALGYTPPTTNTTYSNMKAATASAAGTAGLVPAPAAGKQTAFLRGDGTWVVPTDTNTTYSNMKAATASAAGAAGLVPAPAAGKQTAFLRGDGTWVIPTDTNTTYSAATSSALGLVKVGSNITNSSGTISLTKANVTAALGYTPPITDTNTTYSAFTGASSSVAGSAGLVKAPAAGDQNKFLRGDGTWAADNNTTYAAMSADELSTGTATTSRALTAKVLGDYVKGKTDDKISGLSIDGSTITFTKGNGSTGSFTVPDTSYPALALSDINTGTSTVANTVSAKVLNNYVTDKVFTETTARSDADTVLSNRIGTLSADGNYIKKAATNDISTNMLTLDNALYTTNQNIAGFATDINRNKESIRDMNASVTAALSSVSSTSALVDVIDSLKADSSLNNLTDAGRQVIATAAANAVQEYMAAYGGNSTNATPPMASLMMSANPNTLNITDDGNGSLHVGEGSYVNGTSSIAIGVGNQVNANNAGAFGDPSVINADASYVLGNDDTVNTGAVSSFIVGNDSVSSAKSGLSFGSNNQLQASAIDSVLLGNRTSASGQNSVALGSGSVADEDNVISLGNSSLKRKITHLMDGAVVEDSAEAVTGGQLYQTNERVTALESSVSSKADADASNIDVSKWTDALGVGKVEQGDMGLVTGGAVFNAIDSSIQSSSVATYDAMNNALRIGGSEKYSDVSTIDVSTFDGFSRVITGVATDPTDSSSAANVGYGNAVGQHIVDGVNDGFSKIDDKFRKAGASAAAMASLEAPPMDGDEKWAFSAAVGHYDGKTAGAVGAFFRPQDNLMVNIRGAAGNGEDMVGAGIGISLNRGNTPAVSKAQMVRTINAQAAQITAQAGEIQQLHGTVNELKESHQVEISEMRSQISKLTETIEQLKSKTSA